MLGCLWWPHFVLRMLFLRGWSFTSCSPFDRTTICVRLPLFSRSCTARAPPTFAHALALSPFCAARVTSLLPLRDGSEQAFWSMGLSSFPWAGKAFFATSGLAGVFTTWRQGLFLEDADEARGSWCENAFYPPLDD